MTASLRTLYGVQVATTQYDRLKALTDLLVGESDHREYIDQARRRCVSIALNAAERARTVTRNSEQGPPNPPPAQAVPSFLRGSRVFEPTSHIICVELKNGSGIFRRAALTAEQMAQTEFRLMELKHTGEIKGYLLAGANDCTFPELLAWLSELAFHPQQSELLSIEQDTLFSRDLA
jgi:hypothetical protein